MNKKRILEGLFVLVLVTVFHSCTQTQDIQHDQGEIPLKTDLDFEPATTAEELEALRDNPESGIVRNQQELIQAIRKDEFLNKVFTEELLYEFIIETGFNERGFTTFSYLPILKTYEDYEEILRYLTPKLGFDYDELGYTMDGYQCGYDGFCKESYATFCDSDNCSKQIELDKDMRVIDMLSSYHAFVQQNINPDFKFYSDALSKFPTVKPLEWFFSKFEIEDVPLEKESQEWVNQGLKTGNIHVFGGTVLYEGEEVSVASLVFEKNIDVPEELIGLSGVIFVPKKKIPRIKFKYIYGQLDPCPCFVCESEEPRLSFCNNFCPRLLDYGNVGAFEETLEKITFYQPEWEESLIVLLNLELSKTICDCKLLEPQEWEKP
ncbi:hypothetical protein [Aquimarina algicola]|uniref:Uncharacterized protein n=1 Tax=Aquimarina algicola TaxID=2589995 RepID=A0A504JAA5_9FLAO|nr:hypothetical protein [Aquimarina algicola]TPN87817.1 hypothetical protein FHK87_09595 [Aquimarina algicola]